MLTVFIKSEYDLLILGEVHVFLFQKKISDLNERASITKDNNLSLIQCCLITLPNSTFSQLHNSLILYNNNNLAQMVTLNNGSYLTTDLPSLTHDTSSPRADV